MKKTFVIFLIAAWVFLGLCSEAFCARGGSPGGGYRGGGSPGGGYYRGGSHGGGYYGGGYHRGGYHSYHRGRSHYYFGGYFGFPFYAYPYGYYPYSYYPYGYPYAYPYAYPDYSNTYDQPTIYSEPEQTYSWYYCRDPEGYYPYVTSCPGGWTKVVPAPPGEEGVTK